MTEDQPEPWRKVADEFHIEMGYCISAWARVDDELFRIFRDCIGPLDQSAIIYYRTPGLNVRLDMTNELVQTTLLPSWERPGHADPRLKAWKAAIKPSRDLLSVRRRIAHQPVRWEPRHVGTRLGAAPSYVELYVGANERLRDSQAKLPPLNIDDLRSHRAAVNQLSERLREFYHDVLIKPPEASPPPSLQSRPPSPLEKGRARVHPRRRRGDDAR
jgi:hypothetical protein